MDHTIDKMGGASAHQFTRRKVVLTLACTLWVGVDFRLVLSDKDAGRTEGGGGAQYCTSGSDPTQVVTVIKSVIQPSQDAYLSDCMGPVSTCKGIGDGLGITKCKLAHIV